MKNYLKKYKDILKSLNSESKSIVQIKKETHLSIAKISTTITKLIEYKFIKEKNGKYNITNKGIMLKDLILEIFILIEDDE